MPSAKVGQSSRSTRDDVTKLLIKTGKNWRILSNFTFHNYYCRERIRNNYGKHVASHIFGRGRRDGRKSFFLEGRRGQRTFGGSKAEKVSHKKVKGKGRCSSSWGSPLQSYGTSLAIYMGHTVLSATRHK